MKVKFNSSIVFVNGTSFMINEIAEVEDKLGQQLVKDGVAILVENTEEAKPKKAVRKKEEIAE